jgi:hypothetical protein
MTDLVVEGLTFSFPENWQASKCDDWAFYRNQFSAMWPGIKAVDLVAVDPDKTVWLIEVKDYSRHRRTKPSDLPREISEKVFDTLAAMIPAKVNAASGEEKRFAGAVCKAVKLRVIFHLEQPVKHSKLFPVAIDAANVALKLRKLLKPIDAHPVVASRESMHGLAWTVA